MKIQNIAKILIPLITILLSGCTPDYGAMLRGKDLEISVDKTEIMADGADAVTFKVIQSGNDVTASCKIIMTRTAAELESNTFSTTTPDQYSFYAEGYGKKSNVINVVATGTGIITLVTDKVSIPADNTTAATFSILKGEQDVTAESEIYVIHEDGTSEKINGTEYTSDVIGGKRFYAKNGSEVSDMTIINVMEIDANPDSYTGFAQKGMLLQFTAQGCGPCAKMKEAVAILEEEEYEDGIIIACHTALMPDTMYPTFWKDLWDNYHGKMQGIPAMTFNLISSTCTGNLGEPEMTAATIKTTLSDLMGQYPATSAISAITYDMGETITAHASVKISEAGDYMISAWLLEDGIMGYQQTVTGDVNHHDVLRGKSHEAVTGEAFTAESNSVYDFSFALNTADLVNGNAENSHVVIFVMKKHAEEYIVNNIIDCGYNSSVGYAYR